ncbi:VPLPA-CTERM sorting domain-containing protein [Paracoccus aerius]|uniref:VPLPA-CTERM sorting domain-containing protein n=1 Tax=Paracoccus aerius TaxID=1915382 RepID=A0ABS1S2A4_9RHOB|nr:VPLPA-CTERM sorting domain-containing protein [Paracoccus aerius]MBL3672264.1 VPLPA-CTERM sorting domain-containing protein [Paracoccus aerius]GHG11266.1 hypothetical protein GCM10017322_03440 [Paracoccus aerius]
MKLGAVIAAAVVAVGVGQAEAATYTAVDYDLYLRYEGTAFSDLVAYDQWDLDNTYSSPYYPAEDPLNLDISNKMFPSLAIGDIVRFIATIVFPEDPDQLLGQYDNGGRAPVCAIGKTSCTNTTEAYPKGPYDAFDIRYSDLIMITGSTQVGSAFTYNQAYPGDWASDDGRWSYHAWYSAAKFTVVEIVDTPAPVPLPATAALLPLGIGALATMRKRRKAQAV